MITSIEIHQYEYWPNIQRMKKDGTDQYEFIAFYFEIILKNNLNKKADIHISFLAPLFIDYYEKQLSFNMDLSSNNQNIALQKTKKSKIKTIITGDNDTLKMKLIPTQTKVEEIKSFQELCDSFINQDILPNLNKIKSFLNKYEIEGETKDFNFFLENTLIEIKQFFNEKYLKTQTQFQSEDINSLLFYHILDLQIPVQDKISKKYKV